MSEAFEQEIAALPKLGRVGLQNRWCELFKTAPPAAFTPDLLARGIAHRLQEKALGGLSAAIARQLQSGGQGRAAARPTLRPGNRLVRRWRGKTNVVEVTEAGLVYDGVIVASLRFRFSRTGHFFGCPARMLVGAEKIGKDRFNLYRQI